MQTWYVSFRVGIRKAMQRSPIPDTMKGARYFGSPKSVLLSLGITD